MGAWRWITRPGAGSSALPPVDQVQVDPQAANHDLPLVRDAQPLPCQLPGLAEQLGRTWQDGRRRGAEVGAWSRAMQLQQHRCPPCALALHPPPPPRSPKAHLTPAQPCWWGWVPAGVSAGAAGQCTAGSACACPTPSCRAHGTWLGHRGGGVRGGGGDLQLAAHAILRARPCRITHIPGRSLMHGRPKAAAHVFSRTPQGRSLIRQSMVPGRMGTAQASHASTSSLQLLGRPLVLALAPVLLVAAGAAPPAVLVLLVAAGAAPPTAPGGGAGTAAPAAAVAAAVALPAWVVAGSRAAVGRSTCCRLAAAHSYSWSEETSPAVGEHGVGLDGVGALGVASRLSPRSAQPCVSVACSPAIRAPPPMNKHCLPPAATAWPHLQWTAPPPPSGARHRLWVGQCPLYGPSTRCHGPTSPPMNTACGWASAPSMGMVATPQQASTTTSYGRMSANLQQPPGAVGISAWFMACGPAAGWQLCGIWDCRQGAGTQHAGVGAWLSA